LNDFPDVLGMALHDATALLEAEGLAYIIAETKPTKKELTEGVLRVIRVKPLAPDFAHPEQNQSFELTVCRI
jgi:hypothetical protein